MKDFIQQALQTESKPDEAMLARLTHHVRGIHAYTGLLTEVGELADQFKRAIFYGKDLDLTNIQEELGDLCWYMAVLFDEYGGDFESVMRAVIRKLRARYPNKFTSYDALNRNTVKELQAFTDITDTTGDPIRRRIHLENIPCPNRTQEEQNELQELRKQQGYLDMESALPDPLEAELARLGATKEDFSNFIAHLAEMDRANP